MIMESQKSCQVNSYKSSLWPRERNKARRVSWLVQGPGSRAGDYFHLTKRSAERFLPNYRQKIRNVLQGNRDSFQQLPEEQLMAFRQLLPSHCNWDTHEKISAKALFFKQMMDSTANLSYSNYWITPVTLDFPAWTLSDPSFVRM